MTKQKKSLKVATPDQKAIEEVSAFLNIEADKCIKSMVFKVDEKLVVVLVRGDHEVNDVKVKMYTVLQLLSLPLMKK